MGFSKIFFQISIYFISLWLIFCKFRSYQRSELQVHKYWGYKLAKFYSKNFWKSSGSFPKLLKKYFQIIPQFYLDNKLFFLWIIRRKRFSSGNPDPG